MRRALADAKQRIQHVEREPPLIETEVARLPCVRVILRFVAIQQFEIVVDIDAFVDEAHQSREHRMVQQIGIVKQCERRQAH